MVGVADVPDPEAMTSPMAAAAPSDPHRPGPRPGSGPRPTRGGAIAFHVGGGAVFAAATAAAAFAGFVVSFGTSTCNDPDVSDELRSLRLGLVVITVVWALIPAGWAALGRRLRYSWLPWAALSALVVAGGLVVASMAEVGTFCF
jgi:hypothetical protein